jgi:hypothetical protein
MIALVALAVQRLCMRPQSAAGAACCASAVMDTPANVREAKVPLFGINFSFARTYARHPPTKS